jgi:Holliday junction resolvase RusA-like endonuclease
LYHIKISEINLCSVNDRYTKGFYLSKKYKKCRDNLVLLFKSIKAPGEKPLTGNIGMVVICEQYADIDNYLKVILDSCEKAGLIDNDGNITDLHVLKTRAKKGALNNMEIILR